MPFSVLIEKYPALSSFLKSLHPPKFDLGDPITLSTLNYYLFKEQVGVEIFVPKGHLIPTLGIRFAYAAIINRYAPKKTLVEIGTGASAAISLILAKKFNRAIIATELNEISYQSAMKNIVHNQLEKQITLLKSNGEIIRGLIPESDYGAIISYPPIYSKSDLHLAHKKRGWRGVESELIGGEEPLEFSKKLIKESFTTEKVNFDTISLMVLNKSQVSELIDYSKKFTEKFKIFRVIAGTRERWIILQDI